MLAASPHNTPQLLTTLLVEFFFDHFGQLLNLSLAAGRFLPHLVAEVGPVVTGLEHKSGVNIQDLFHILPARRDAR